MPMCKPGREIPEQGLTPTSLLFEDVWGEVWRAEHDSLGSVVFVAFTTHEGQELFRQALPTLKRWKQEGAASTPRLLPILKIAEDSPVPYHLVQDPGGPSLRELEEDITRELEGPDVVRWMAGLVEGLLTATTMLLVPIGITPDTILYANNEAQARWRLVPVMPGPVLARARLARGRYTPPGLDRVADPGVAHADCYALSWIAAEFLAGNFDLPRDPNVMDKAVPLAKLAKELKAGVQTRDGMCIEPGMLETIFKRWLRNEAEKEGKNFKAVRKKRNKARAGAMRPAGSAEGSSETVEKLESSVDKGKIVRLVAGIVGGVLFLAAAVWGVLQILG